MRGTTWIQSKALHLSEADGVLLPSAVTCGHVRNSLAYAFRIGSSGATSPSAEHGISAFCRSLWIRRCGYYSPSSPIDMILLSYHKKGLLSRKK